MSVKGAVALVTLVAALAMVPAAYAGQEIWFRTPGGVPGHADFTWATNGASNPRDTQIFSRLAGLVRDADTGSYIYLTLYDAKADNEVMQELTKAVNRGVYVYILHDKPGLPLTGATQWYFDRWC